MAAIRVYNDPGTRFKSETFIVLMVAFCNGSPAPPPQLHDIAVRWRDGESRL